MTSSAKTVIAYLEALPVDRREAISEVRDVILANLPEGYEEVMQYGMISYVIPFSRYPKTYNNQPLAIVSLASQKNHMAVYMMCVYGDIVMREKFIADYLATGKKLDIGKSCLRFKHTSDLALGVIGDVIAHTSTEQFIRNYEKSRLLAKNSDKLQAPGDGSGIVNSE